MDDCQQCKIIAQDATILCKRCSLIANSVCIDVGKNNTHKGSNNKDSLKNDIFAETIRQVAVSYLAGKIFKRR